MRTIIIPLLLVTTFASHITAMNNVIPLPILSRKIPQPIEYTEKIIIPGKAQWTVTDLDNAIKGYISIEYALGVHMPLHCAVMAKNIPRIRFFLNNPALENRAIRLNEALDLAIHRDDEPTIDFIIGAGADPLQWFLHNQYTIISTKVFNFLVNKCSAKTVQPQKHSGIESFPTQENTDLDAKLDLAIKTHDAYTVTLLIDSGANAVRWINNNKSAKVSTEIFTILENHLKYLDEQKEM